MGHASSSDPPPPSCSATWDLQCSSFYQLLHSCPPVAALPPHHLHRCFRQAFPATSQQRLFASHLVLQPFATLCSRPAAKCSLVVLALARLCLPSESRPLLDEARVQHELPTLPPHHGLLLSAWVEDVVVLLLWPELHDVPVLRDPCN